MVKSVLVLFSEVNSTIRMHGNLYFLKCLTLARPRNAFTAFYQKQGTMRGALNKFLITIQKLVFQKFKFDLQMRTQVLIGIEGAITLCDKDIISIWKLKRACFALWNVF